MFYFSIGGKVRPHGRRQSLRPAASVQQSDGPAAGGGEDDRNDCASNDRTNGSNISAACRGHSAPNSAEYPDRHEHAYQEIRFVLMSSSFLSVRIIQLNIAKKMESFSL